MNVETDFVEGFFRRNLRRNIGTSEQLGSVLCWEELLEKTCDNVDVLFWQKYAGVGSSIKSVRSLKMWKG